MPWFNAWGLVIVAVMMVPNILYAIKCKEGFENKYHNKLVEAVEQIGRFGCFGFMVINIPGTVLGWWFDGALTLYLAVNFTLLLLYLAVWVICFWKNNVFRALSLSILPSVIFLFSGVLSRSVLLMISAVLFMCCHVQISYQNAIRA